jgi:hypothetical protein
MLMSPHGGHRRHLDYPEGAAGDFAFCWFETLVKQEGTTDMRYHHYLRRANGRCGKQKGQS